MTLAKILIAVPAFALIMGAGIAALSVAAFFIYILVYIAASFVGAV